MLLTETPLSITKHTSTGNREAWNKLIIGDYNFRSAFFNSFFNSQFLTFNLTGFLQVITAALSLNFSGSEKL